MLGCQPHNGISILMIWSSSGQEEVKEAIGYYSTKLISSIGACSLLTISTVIPALAFIQSVLHANCSCY